MLREICFGLILIYRWVFRIPHRTGLSMYSRVFDSRLDGVRLCTVCSCYILSMARCIDFPGWNKYTRAAIPFHSTSQQVERIFRFSKAPQSNTQFIFGDPFMGEGGEREWNGNWVLLAVRERKTERNKKLEPLFLFLLM